MKQLKVQPLLQIVLIVSLALGLFLRVYNLDRKIFWHDEAYTAIPLSGYTKEEIRVEWIQQFLQNDRILQVPELHQYQAPSPETYLSDTIRAVAVEEPQNSPLYFIVAKLFLSHTGISPVIGMRSLSVFFSFCAFAATLILCHELFADKLTRWLALGVITISPFHLLYAQEARQYSLLTAVIFFASTSLLKAIKAENSGRWVTYAIALTIGLYVQPLFALVGIAHGLYVLGVKDIFPKYTLKRYGQAFTASCLLFSPWLFITLMNLEAISPWRKKTVLPFLRLVGRWVLNIGRSFYDGSLPGLNQYDLQLSQPNMVALIMLACLLVVIYSFYYLVKNSEKKIWLFIISLAAVPSIPFVILDCLFGGVRSTIPRYFIPCYIALQLAVAYCLGHQIKNVRLHGLKSLWRTLAVALLLAGSIASIRLSLAETWWTKYSNYYDLEVAAIINSASQPVVLGEEPSPLISLSYLLESDVFVQMLDRKNPVRAPEVNSLFVYNSDRLRQSLEEQNGYCSTRLYDQPLYFIDRNVQLWRLQKCSESEVISN